ncbi:MAG: insulinase family protein [Bacteroidetes bacterium]|nr:insulinase family protein [Bacteroidota bacterium]
MHEFTSTLDEYQLHEFPNGLRLYHQQVASRITHCGFVIDAGSRDEYEEEMGMAHFIEHLLFKGTTHRKSIHILNRLEVVGGELNAYTTKDKTCVYAAVNSDYFPRTAELLSDIVFYSNFPEKELEKERNVIHEEIDMYLDSPEENILDLFQEKAFPNHALGYNILGTHQSLNKLDRTSILHFYRSWYTPEKMVFVYSGPKSFKQVIRILDKQLSVVPAAKGQAKTRISFNSEIYSPFVETQKTSHVQTYLTLGGLAPSNQMEERSAMALLTNIMGGPGLNSRLNLAIREKHGFAYDVETSFQTMRDMGQFHIYLGTDKRHLEKARELIFKELKFWREKGLNKNQLERYKNQFKGQILMGEENRSGLILSAGKMLLDNRPIDSLEKVFERIDAITSEQMRELANQYLHPDRLSELIFLGDKIPDEEE